MASPTLIAFERSSVGRACEVERRETDWVFAFGKAPDGCVIVTAALWRVVDEGRIVLTSQDDHQQFGLQASVDAELKCRAVLDGRLVLSVRVDPLTSDVTIQFERGARLDIISTSSAYQNWQAYFQSAGVDVTLVGGGGGECLGVV